MKKLRYINGAFSNIIYKEKRTAEAVRFVLLGLGDQISWIFYV